MDLHTPDHIETFTHMDISDTLHSMSIEFLKHPDLLLALSYTKALGLCMDHLCKAVGFSRPLNPIYVTKDLLEQKIKFCIDQGIFKNIKHAYDIQMAELNWPLYSILSRSPKQSHKTFKSIQSRSNFVNMDPNDSPFRGSLLDMNNLRPEVQSAVLDLLKTTKTDSFLPSHVPKKLQYPRT